MKDAEDSVPSVNTAKYLDEKVNIETLVGKHILTKDGQVISVCRHFKAKKILIYFFSAAWAPAIDVIARLKSLYVENLNRNTRMEIIFVSSDTDESTFNQYFAEQGPWCAIPFRSAICDELRWMYGITCLPQIIVIRTDGTVITRKGKDELESLGNNVIVCWAEYIQQ
ncbi:unnamed protein product [Phaedon cochleariae]|uniref:protein-disulfide reductase n=1 Tax=Phaedon cochleariae TaxID=80249 RepID=A0A9N9SKD1_PHACE|nr:unnamed protein product [Phaedon cochleariae]